MNLTKEQAAFLLEVLNTPNLTFALPKCELAASTAYALKLIAEGPVKTEMSARER